MPDQDDSAHAWFLHTFLSVSYWLMIVLPHYSGNNAIPGTGTAPNPSLLSRIPLNSHYIENRLN